MVIAAHGLVPGDRLPTRTVALHSAVDARYDLGMRLRGSQSLAQQLRLRITGVETAELVYDGLLSDFGGAVGRRLAAARTERLVIALSLPLTAGNAVQGATLEAALSVTAWPLVTP